MNGKRVAMRAGLWVCAVSLSLAAAAAPPGDDKGKPGHDDRPLVSIIIDDLGNRPVEGRRALALPGPVTVGILPHTPYAEQFARTARQRDKEVILHLPMESQQGRPLGPGGLHKCMTREEFEQTLRRDLAAVPHIRGVNNHMGSELTQSPLLMEWLMHTLADHGDLYFVDSRTTAESQALDQASDFALDHATRDVFLDYRTEPAYIKEQLAYLVQRAKREGSAVAIGHPYPETLAVLEQAIPELARQGVRLVRVSRLIELRKQRRLAWQTSSYPSPKAAKNSKPLP